MGEKSQAGKAGPKPKESRVKSKGGGKIQGTAK